MYRMADLEKQKNFIDALNTYYKLKNQYEINFNKEKNKIINLEGLSWKEKRTEFKKIKRKCINCKRPVGSKFSTRSDKYERHLIALCGDTANPCPFNIDINTGIMFDTNDMLIEDEDNLSRFKKYIIVYKNDLLFGYIPTHIAVKRFDDIKEQITSTTNLYETVLQNYNNIVNNSEKKEALIKLQTELYANIDTFKSIIAKYDETENTQLVNDAVELYINTMIPRLKEIMKKKYSYSGVDYDKNDNTLQLIQKPVTIKDFETDVGDDGETVVSLKMGVEVKSSTSARKKPVEKAITAAIPGIKEKESVVLPKALEKKILFVNTETEREANKMGELGEKEKEEASDNESASNYSSESESESESESGSGSESESETNGRK